MAGLALGAFTGCIISSVVPQSIFNLRNLARRYLHVEPLVIGENANFGGNEEFMRQHGVEVVIADDPACRRLMKQFIDEKPALWDEDIAGRDDR